MINEIKDLVKRLNDPITENLNIIKWACPIPTFGNPELSKIATLGLNPSDKEFFDNDGNELEKNKRRFHTLNSLKISDWGKVTEEGISKIYEQCKNYFSINPYDGWFKKLDYLISGTSMSYYFPSCEACHLDLIPYATSIKWGNLTTLQKNSLLSNFSDILGTILKKSSIQVLVLNGKTVIENFKEISDVDYVIKVQSDWVLPRTGKKGVLGYSYEGFATKIGNIDLEKKIYILGFNHNIQSSFGVTSLVQSSIRNWITKTTTEHL